MKGITFKTRMGSLVCFVDSKFPEFEEDKILENPEIYYIRLVFFKTSELQRIINKFYSFPVPVDVCLDGCASIEALNQLLSLQHMGHIRQIIVSMQDVYKSLLFPSVLIGAEKWDFFGTPDGLCTLDLSVQSIADTVKLNASIDIIVNEVLADKPQNDLEKILLVDRWFQKNVQYIKGRESKANGIIYICDEMNRESCAEDVLLNRFGRCEDIAFAAAMILNHPRIGVPCRQVSAVREDGFNHSWNIVRCQGLEYYTDFTHNITQNPDRVPYALKAKSYSNQFTLLGVEDAGGKYGLTTVYRRDRLSLSSFDREHINKILCTFINRGISLRWGESLVKKSHIK